MQLKTMMLTLVAIGALTAVADPRVYYVDANRGNDAWTGTADWEHRDETTVPVTGPKQTLAALPRTNGSASATNVFHLAAGEYREGIVTNSLYGMDAYYRLSIPKYTRVVCDGTRGSAVICGAGATTADANAYGNGSNAVRCVCAADATSVIVGCALTGGRSFITSNTTVENTARHHRGSGALTGALRLIDCIVTNNIAYENGGVAYAQGMAAFRCFFDDNHAIGGQGEVANYSGTFFNCVFGARINTGKTLNYKAANSGSLAAYNCLFLGASHRAIAYNCIYIGEETIYTTGSPTGANNLFTDSDKHYSSGFGTQISSGRVPYDVNYRPLKTSVAVDAADFDRYWTAITNSSFAAFARLDYAGGPRVCNGALDIGPGEYNWYPLDETTGLTVTTNGQTVSIKRNYTSDRLVTGFTFNGTAVVFADHPEGQVFTYPYVGDIGEQTISVTYAEKTEYYVNPTTGKDTNRGYGPYCAFKTLAALPRTAGTSADTNVFHLAAGIYREGIVTNAFYNMDAYYRLYLPKFTRVVCDDAPGSAIICGADATAEDRDEDGNGADAVRCVCAMDATCVLVGCTLTGGRSFVNSTSTDRSVKIHHRGSAAVVGHLTIVDCVVTNNRCAQSAAVSYAQDGVAIRSYFANNKASTVATDYYYSGKLFDCVFAESVGGVNHNSVTSAGSTGLVAYNCLFVDGGHNATAYNCIMLDACGSYLRGTNDLVTDRNDAYYIYGDRERVITAKQVPYDGDYRPLKTSLAVDAGNLEVYQSALAAAGIVDGGRDFAGGQRVYNGKIDIGPGEYDWRGDFAPILNRKCVTIDAMSAGVTTNETVSSVVLSGGDALTIRITSKADGPCSLRALAASGEVTVVANGAAVAPATGGVFEFNGVAGENTVTVSYVGEATCAVDSVKAAGLGLLLLLR